MLKPIESDSSSKYDDQDDQYEKKYGISCDKFIDEAFDMLHRNIGRR